MKAIKGLIAAIEGGISLTLYRNSFEAIAEYVAQLQTDSSGMAPNKSDLTRLVQALDRTSSRFSQEKFLASIGEYTRRYNNEFATSK